MDFIESFIQWSHECLKNSDEAKSYLMGRGVSIDQMELHRIGYTGGEFESNPKKDIYHNENCSLKDKKSLWCDSCIYNNWSSDYGVNGARIRGRIVLPLTSLTRKCSGFQTRSIEEKSYDTFISRRNQEALFFGSSVAIDHIWNSSSVILVEGPFDQLIIERLVKKNVLAITTSSISKIQRRAILRFVSRVYLGMDFDSAGREGIESFLKYSDGKFDSTVLRYSSFLSGVKDPNDLWKITGDSKFKLKFSDLDY
jgi:DNA primase